MTAPTASTSLLHLRAPPAVPGAFEPDLPDPARPAGETFAARLDRLSLPGAMSPEEREEKAYDSARSLVAITLVQPILSELRASNQAAEPFAPTPAERQFRSMLDARVAESIVARSDFPLVEKVARRVLMKHDAPKDAAAADPTRQGGPHALTRTDTLG